MKKALSLILCAVLLFSLAVPAFAADSSDDGLNVIVANDLHYNLRYSSQEAVARRNSIDETYYHIASTGRLVYESAAIIKAFLEDIATSDREIVLLPGDLVDEGGTEEHTVFTKILSDFEKETGKRVYVVPGNHDLYGGTTVAEFETFYRDFGYSEALANDPLSASYTAELGGDYRLLAIDSTDPGEGGHGINEERLAWIKAQCDKAKKDGKKLIAIMHHNLLDHFSLDTTIHSGSSVNTDINLADVLADGGVKYIFTGHIHVQNILSYTAKDGSVIYDVVTSTLNGWPCPYREVDFGDEVKIRTKYVDEVDTTLFPAGITDEALSLAKSDFLAYAKNCADVGMELVVRGYANASKLTSVLKLDKEKDAELYNAVTVIAERLDTVLNMPLYAADETEEGQSLEALVASYGKTLPASDYETYMDLGVSIYLAFVGGDENYQAYTDEIVILMRGLAAVLSYSFAEVSANEYAQFLSLILGLANIKVSADSLVFTGGLAERFKGTELILTNLLLPVVLSFSADTLPADNDITLPGYDEIKEELTFFQKVLDWFQKILSFIVGIFKINIQ